MSFFGNIYLFVDSQFVYFLINWMKISRRKITKKTWFTLSFSVVIHTPTEPFWNGLQSMPFHFLLRCGLPTPVLYDWVFRRRQHRTTRCLEPVRFAQKILIELPFSHTIKQFVRGRLRVVCSHIRGFLWFLLVFFLVCFPPFFGFSLHFTVGGLRLGSYLK